MKVSVCVLLWASLASNVKANRVRPLRKIIKLSSAVSKATYLPLAGKRYLQDGLIIGNPTTISPRRFLGIFFLNPKYDVTQDRVSCSMNDWEAKHHHARETEAFVFSNAHQRIAVFGFRGTEALNLLDWIWNFDMGPTKTYINKTVFVTHKGFRNRYLNVASWFETEYMKIPHNYTIIITGHSLGGAEASIAAVFAAGKLQRRPDAVVTFGSPLVGDRSFISYYNTVVGCDRTLRIVSKGDLFAAVPQVFGYTHACPAVNIDGNTGQNVIRAHDMYIGYDGGLAKLFRPDDIDSGCDKPL